MSDAMYHGAVPGMRNGWFFNADTLFLTVVINGEVTGIQLKRRRRDLDTWLDDLGKPKEQQGDPWLTA
jgi:hypothetical protein